MQNSLGPITISHAHDDSACALYRFHLSSSCNSCADELVCFHFEEGKVFQFIFFCLLFFLCKRHRTSTSFQVVFFFLPAVQYNEHSMWQGAHLLTNGGGGNIRVVCGGGTTFAAIKSLPSYSDPRAFLERLIHHLSWMPWPFWNSLGTVIIIRIDFLFTILIFCMPHTKFCVILSILKSPTQLNIVD